VSVFLSLNPFGSTLLQFVDFRTTSGAELSSEPQIGIYDSQLLNSQACEPIDFPVENRKSLRRLGIRPSPVRSGPKIKAVLPPSHLIGRARIHNEKRYTACLLLSSKADSTARFISTPPSRTGCRKGGGVSNDRRNILYRGWCRGCTSGLD
jgi:hypothetical protein